jgi:hypothetical protein
MHRSRPLTAAALCLLAAACSGGAGDAPASGEVERLENQQIQIAVEVPVGGPFEVVSNAGEEIRLRFRGDGEFEPADVVYSAFPEQDYGVNLYDAVNRREEEIEGRPGGQFFGQVELVSQLGPAFNTRGRYTAEEGGAVEEVRVFAVHPTVNRIVHMTYRYPPTPGQTEARMLEQAFEAFGYIEPLDAPPPAEGEAEAGEAGAGAADEPGATTEGGAIE